MSSLLSLPYFPFLHFSILTPQLNNFIRLNFLLKDFLPLLNSLLHRISCFGTSLIINNGFVHLGKDTFSIIVPISFIQDKLPGFLASYSSSCSEISLFKPLSFAHIGKDSSAIIIHKILLYKTQLSFYFSVSQEFLSSLIWRECFWTQRSWLWRLVSS